MTSQNVTMTERGNRHAYEEYPRWRGLYALVLTQQTAFAHGQTIYAFRQSLFLRSIPQNPLALQEFAQAA